MGSTGGERGGDWAGGSGARGGPLGGTGGKCGGRGMDVGNGQRMHVLDVGKAAGADVENVEKEAARGLPPRRGGRGGIPFGRTPPRAGGERRGPGCRRRSENVRTERGHGREGFAATLSLARGAELRPRRDRRRCGIPQGCRAFGGNAGPPRPAATAAEVARRQWQALVTVGKGLAGLFGSPPALGGVRPTARPAGAMAEGGIRSGAASGAFSRDPSRAPAFVAPQLFQPRDDADGPRRRSTPPPGARGESAGERSHLQPEAGG